MPVILSLDTSGPFCSVALARDDHRWAHSRRVDRQHNLHLLGMIDEICTEGGILARNLEGVVYVKGPGSFTGVRLAVAATQALAFGSGAKVLGVTTSGALALHARAQGLSRCVSAVRSRGLLWYLAAWDLTGNEPRQTRVDQLVDSPPAWLAGYDTVAGEPAPWLPAGMRRLPEDEQPARTVLEQALRLWGGGGWTDAEGALPVYVDGDHPWQPANPGAHKA